MTAGPDVQCVRDHPVNRCLHEIPVVEDEIRMNSQHPNTEPLASEVTPVIRLERLQMVGGSIRLNRNAVLDDVVKMSNARHELLHADPIA